MCLPGAGTRDITPSLAFRRGDGDVRAVMVGEGGSGGGADGRGGRLSYGQREPRRSAEPRKVCKLWGQREGVSEEGREVRLGSGRGRTTELCCNVT